MKEDTITFNITNMENTKKLECEDCGYVATSERKLTKHYRKCPDNSSTSSSEDFVCSMCTYTADRKSDLSKHIKTKHTSIKTPTKRNALSPRAETTPENNDTLQCTKCDYVAHRKRNLTKHYKRHHGSSSIDTSPASCPETPVKNSTDLKCSECGYIAGNKGGLTTHYKRRHGSSSSDTPPGTSSGTETPVENITDFKCTKCDYVASRKYHLKRHNQRKHTSAENSSQDAASSSKRERAAEKIEDFKCTKCDYVAHRKSDLTQHYRNIHTSNKKANEETPTSLTVESVVSNSKKYKCSKCDYFAYRKCDLTQHDKLRHTAGHTMTSPKRFQCAKCEYSTSHIEHFENHLVTHTGERAFSCDICAKKFMHRRNLLRHELTHRKTKRFQCSKCDYSTSRKDQLTQHSLTHKAFSCVRCGKKFRQRQTLMQHELTHRETKKFQCSKCDYTASLKQQLMRHQLTHEKFERKQKLIQHMKTHPNQRKFKCASCTKRFKTKKLLRSHTTVHSGKYNFKCRHCTYKSKWKSDVTRHTKTVHSAGRSYRCDVCQRIFTTVQHLNDHYSVHSNDFRHRCSQCPYQTNSASHLKRHVSIHSDREMKCKYCSKSFKDERRHIAHVKSHSVPRTGLIKCLKCDSQHTSALALEAHIRKKHFVCSKCKTIFMSKHCLTNHERMHCPLGKQSKSLVATKSQNQNASIKNMHLKTSEQNISVCRNRKRTRSSSQAKLSANEDKPGSTLSGQKENMNNSRNQKRHRDTFQDDASSLDSYVDTEREEIGDQSTPEPEHRREQTAEIIQIMNRYIKAHIPEWTSETSITNSQLKSPKERNTDEDSQKRIEQYLVKLGVEPFDLEWVPSYGLMEIEDLLLKFIEEDEQALQLKQSRIKRRLDMDRDEQNDQNNTMISPKQDHIPRKKCRLDRKMQGVENGFTRDTDNQVGKGNDDVAENEISETKKRIANYLHQIGQLPINLDEVPLDRLKGMEALLLGYVREDAEERALQGEQRVQPNMHHNIENCEDVRDIDTANDEEVERLFLGVQLRESEIDDLLDEVHGKSSESMADVFINQKNKQLKCDECERMFTSKNRLKIHKDFCSKILVLNCNMCSATYSRKEHLFAHVAKKHQSPNKAEGITTITETNSEDRVYEREEGAPSDPMTHELFSRNELDKVLHNEPLDDIRERIKILIHEVDYPDAAGVEAFIEGMSLTKLKTLEARVKEYGKQEKEEIDERTEQGRAEETSVRLNKLKLVVVEEVEQSSMNCIDFEFMFCQPTRDEGQTEQGHQETQSENTREIDQSSEDQQAEQPSGKSIENSPDQQNDVEKHRTEINECDDVNDKIEETECESGEEMMVAESGEVVFVLNQSQFKSLKQNEPSMTEPEQNENKGDSGAQVKSVVVEEVQQSSMSGDVEMMRCHSPRDERGSNQCHLAKSINVREVDQTSEDQRAEERSCEYSKNLTIPNQKDDHDKDGAEINALDNIDDKREEMEEEMMVGQSGEVGFGLNQSQSLHQNKTTKNGPQHEENTEHGVSPRSHVFVKDRFYRIFGGKSPHYDSDQETITEEINMQALDLSVVKNHTARAHGENGLDTLEVDHAGTQNPGTDTCEQDRSETQTKGRNPQDCLVTQHVWSNMDEQNHLEAQSPRTDTYEHGRGPQDGSEDDSVVQTSQPLFKMEQPRRSTSTLPPGGLPAWAGIPRLEPTEDFTEDDWILMAKLEDLIPN